MSFEIYQGDALDNLRTIPEASVHCCVTSPPYWGLRNYGIEPSIWDEDPFCAHEWGSQERGRRGDILPSEQSEAGRLGTHENQGGQNNGGRFCSKCSAWLGCLGLEPTPDLFVQHIVQVFREVRRVLHPTGTLWLNLGDCYITAPHGDGHTFDPKYGGRNRKEGYTANRLGGKDCGLKSKDLVMIPARVALALQADGWYLRSQIPWIKRSGMPESTVDRPSTMVEYIYLFSKSEEYFYDREAVTVPQAEHERTRRLREQAEGLDTVYDIRREDESHGQVRPGQTGVAKSVKARQELALKGVRARRNSDWFLDSLKGLYTDGAGDPLAMLVNPQPFSLEMCELCQHIYNVSEFRKLPKADDRRVCACGATKWISHFATFPEAMVEPCVLAGTSERGCCQHCGAPWERIVDRPFVGDWHPSVNRGADRTEPQRMVARTPADRERKVAGCSIKSNSDGLAGTMLGWRPTCSHPLFPCEVVPCTVLDPFSGSGRAGLVAVRHGRNFIGIERNANYIRMAKWQHARQEALA